MSSSDRIVVRVPAFLAEHVPAFVEETRSQRGAVRHALARGDAGAYRTVGHNLKGSAGAFGCHDLGAMGRELEDASLANDPDRMEALADSIEQYLDRMDVVPDAESAS